MPEIPEDCKLTAHDTGDGWALCVENQEHNVIAYLKWPETWPQIMNAADLRAKGFLII